MTERPAFLSVATALVLVKQCGWLLAGPFFALMVQGCEAKCPAGTVQQGDLCLRAASTSDAGAEQPTQGHAQLPAVEDDGAPKTPSSHQGQGPTAGTTSGADENVRADSAGPKDTDMAGASAPSSAHLGDAGARPEQPSASSAADGGVRTAADSPSTPASSASCVADASCIPEGAPCSVGKTACTSGSVECLELEPASDGTLCPDGVCSSGHCCPRGQIWTDGAGCQVDCSAEQRRCGTSCVSPSEPCNGACSEGHILCNGVCRLGDCCDHAACGRCKKCVDNKCTNQDAFEDLGDDCYEGPCGTGFCNGSGDCGYLPRGTVYCEVTRLISCSGGESFTDAQCPHNCSPSCKPTDPTCRGEATCNECQPGLGFHKCASGTSVAECGSDGRWLPGVACPPGQVCQGDEYTARCTSP